MTEVWK